MPRYVRDASPNGNDLILVGNDLSTTQAKFGAGALACSAGNYGLMQKAIQLPGDFTIEGHGKYTTTGVNQAFFSAYKTPSIVNGGDEYELFSRSGSSQRLTFYVGTGTNLIVGITTPGTNTYCHWALVRSGSTTTLYTNGVVQGSTATAVDFANRVFAFGAWLTGTEPLIGFLDEIRISSMARYTAAFTPPSAAFPTGGSDPDWSSVLALLSFDASDMTATGAYSLAGVPGKAELPGWFTTSSLADQMGLLNLTDIYFGGTGKVVGDVAIDDDPDIPVARRVWLIRMRDGALIRETWSDAVTGAYSFFGVDITQRYAVLAFDQTHVFNAVIADNIPAEPM